MTGARANYTATLLPNGRVLLAGGAGGKTAERYDPAGGTFTATRAPMTADRTYHTATLLPNGKVLIAGGYNVGITNTAELYDSGGCGMEFNVTFEPSTSGAPAEFFTAFNNAIQYYQALFCDPITINIHVGWGDVRGNPLGPGLGGIETNQQGYFTYAQVRTKLIEDRRTTDDATSLTSLPAIDPTGGRNFVMSNAQAKALGLLDGDATDIDGWVGFSKTLPWTFDPNSRAVPGRTDFIGFAHLAITEVMGRTYYGQNVALIDLFRYFSPGMRDLSPGYSNNDSSANYFSIDGGVSVIHNFNVVCCNDLSDWASGVDDAYNAYPGSGVKNPVSAGDLTVMDVVGYDRLRFTDDPLVAGVTEVKALHITELRTRIDYLRAQFYVPPYGYSRSSIAAGTSMILAVDILEMRAALSVAYDFAGVPQPTYRTSPQIGTPVVAADIASLRLAVIALEPH